MKIGLIQSKASSDTQQNIENIKKNILTLAQSGAKIICMEELFASIYFPQYPNQNYQNSAVSSSEDWTDEWSRICRQLEIVLIYSFYEKYRKHFYNSILVFDTDGTILGCYRKNHMPHDPCYWEKDYFEPGNLGYPVFKTNYGTIGVLICYDQWFPEAAREMALQGADIIFYPTSIGHVQSQFPNENWKEAWMNIQRSHAIANNVYVASVNRVGVEDQIHFWGSSFVVDPFGSLIQQASTTDEELIVAEVDFSKIQKFRSEWGFYENLRLDSYSNIKKNMQSSQKPSALGYFMPAEWHPHDGVWLAWPYDDKECYPKNLAKVQDAYLDIIQAIHKSDPVYLVVAKEELLVDVKKRFSNLQLDYSKIFTFVYPYTDIWFRDFGPIYIIQPKWGVRAMTKWHFNAWGNKYQSIIRDGEIPKFISEITHENMFEANIVMEGGSIEVNGKGVLLTTRQCLLNENRNPGLSQITIEKYLQDFLGVTHIVWLEGNVDGDDTDGHIDNVARFVNENTIVYCLEKNKEDRDFAWFKKNEEILQSSLDQDEKPFNLIAIPVPHVFDDQGKRLPASYANFYIGNNVVLVPSYGVAEDDEALTIYKSNFKGRDVQSIDCRDIVYGLGSIHCLSQQIPSQARSS